MTLFSEELVEFANLRSTGTKMPRASAKDIFAYLITKPSNDLLRVFDQTLSVFWKKGLENIKETSALVNLRDTLLPKLLSGELRISDAENLAAEVL